MTTKTRLDPTDLRPDKGKYLHWGYKRQGVWYGLCGTQVRSDHPGYGTKGNGKPICPTCEYLNSIEGIA